MRLYYKTTILGNSANDVVNFKFVYVQFCWQEKAGEHRKLYQLEQSNIKKNIKHTHAHISNTHQQPQSSLILQLISELITFGPSLIRLLPLLHYNSQAITRLMFIAISQHQIFFKVPYVL